jgi:hypothetical protein
VYDPAPIRQNDQLIWWAAMRAAQARYAGLEFVVCRLQLLRLAADHA